MVGKNNTNKVRLKWAVSRAEKIGIFQFSCSV